MKTPAQLNPFEQYRWLVKTALTSRALSEHTDLAQSFLKIIAADYVISPALASELIHQQLKERRPEGLPEHAEKLRRLAESTVADPNFYHDADAARASLQQFAAQNGVNLGLANHIISHYLDAPQHHTQTSRLFGSNRPGGLTAILDAYRTNKWGRNLLAPSPRLAAELKDYCQKRSEPFTDPDLPIQHVVNQESGYELAYTDMKRVSDIIKRPTLFRTGASLSGVKQGYIGNCWFCSLTASIANSNPGVIFDRIYPRTYNPHGFYLVRVYVDGHPYDVVVDDFIPTDEAGNAMFGRSEDASEIWFMIYEKAFAKLWGCYQFLVGGHPRNLGLDWASKLMARSMYWWKDIPHAPEHGTWADLNGHIEQGWSIVAATRAESHVEEHGLVSYHAYTVLATFDHQGDRLVVIRNPWGHGEWSGAWSDRDHTTQAQRYMLFNLAARDDGIFFIPMEDFCRNFGKLMFFRD